MVHFVGAGSGAPDLITVRGSRLLGQADQIIYAGSLVNPAVLEYKKADAAVYDSARLTLEEVIDLIREAERDKKMTVRLHTGEPSLYGAIREQMDALDSLGISYDMTPGVSSFCAAASALNLEYTLPGLSQSLIITRMAGRTPVPARETIESFAAHQSTMVIFLSAGAPEELESRLLAGGYAKDTPTALVYKASWPEEEVHVFRLEDLAKTVRQYGLTRTALIIVGQVVAQAGYKRSRLYDPFFETGFRKRV